MGDRVRVISESITGIFWATLVGMIEAPPPSLHPVLFIHPCFTWHKEEVTFRYCGQIYVSGMLSLCRLYLFGWDLITMPVWLPPDVCVQVHLNWHVLFVNKIRYPEIDCMHLHGFARTPLPLRSAFKRNVQLIIYDCLPVDVTNSSNRLVITQRRFSFM